MKKKSLSIKEANLEFRNKNYKIALEMYLSLRREKYELENIIDFNINLAQKKLSKFKDDQKTIPQNAVVFNNQIAYEEMKRIAIEKNYYDDEYYLRCNQDVAESNIDGFEHYVNFGWKEYRNPSENFNTKYYLSLVDDTKVLNPIQHYFQYGRAAGLKTKEISEDLIGDGYLCKLFCNEKIEALMIDKPIDILVPIFNGFEYLKPLFDSIFENTDVSFRLIIADDASTDDRVQPYLQTLLNEHTNITLIKNNVNLGFVKTVNKLHELTQNHFVLLNTDTEVPRGWLSRLMRPIFEGENVATTTPFTNSGTICSFPNYLEDNELPSNLTVNDVDYFFQRISNPAAFIELPTGVGFCMGINKVVADRLGMFDEIFGRGYGEENDFCQSALKLGFINLHVPNLYVFHKHGVSFTSKEKKQLIEKNLAILVNKHPEYNANIATVIEKNELSAVRKIINFQIKSKNKKINLIIDHGLGGGGSDYLKQMMDKVQWTSNSVIIVENVHSENKIRIKFALNQSIQIVKSPSIDDVLNFILLNFNIQEVLINSIVGFKETFKILDILKRRTQNYKLVVPIHDYFPVCPSYTLINNEGVFCKASTDFIVCSNCLKNNNNESKKFNNSLDIALWRKSWGDFLDLADEILCFSKSSKSIINKIYPNVSNKVVVNPHDISGRFQNIYIPSYEIHNRLTIGVLGGINYSKGLGVLKNISQYIDDRKLNAEIVVFGDVSEKVDCKSFFNTGRYTIDDLPPLVMKYDVSIFLLPSICPETYSYTADEVMQLGYPLAVFDVGAPPERVAHYERGLILSSDAPAVVMEEITNFLKKSQI
jgi:GT2 family glycosyltransferase/glycosyltransferase involved in cell wall biosynthesis